MAKVLVADDNPLSLEFFREALRILGHDVCVAQGGNEALALAAERCFDLLLIDTRMPDLSGPKTLRSIRAGNGASCASPALASSADRAIDHSDLIAAGFSDVLAKPVDLATLGAAVARWLPRTGGSQVMLLDDARALEKTGENASIVSALRGLLAVELDALPAEVERYARNEDSAGLRERLHRLDASAGFCGTPALSDAVDRLRQCIDAGAGWPRSELEGFLDVCARTRQALG